MKNLPDILNRIRNESLFDRKDFIFPVESFHSHPAVLGTSKYKVG